MHNITTCGISDANDFHSLWHLPKLPLTERFGAYRPEHSDLVFDQELVMSLPTGHVQLRRQLDPAALYTSSEYSFRTAQSQSARTSTEFFIRYFKTIAGNRSFQSLVDVGGNDLYLAQELAGVAKHRSVIDPICSATDGQTVDGIKVFGRFIENVDLSKDIPQPDLVLCRHTLEHIARPREVLRQCFEQCHPEALYVAEVPCFENLVCSLRFDAVFHQHYHYYDLASFRHLIWECGGQYMGHTYNYRGSCGGALLVAFRRARERQDKPAIDLNQRIAWLEKRIKLYRQQMDAMAEVLTALPQPVFGYGAGLMLATLGYQLGTDFASLQCVLDDDLARDGSSYENVPVTVRHPSLITVPEDSSFVVTSLENVRPIVNKIGSLKARKILVPVLI